MKTVIDRNLKNLRRLTGANLMMEDHGAAAEAEMDATLKPVVIGLWRQAARALLDGVGWQESRIALRTFEGGASLQVSAPTDVLYAATELVEAAWSAVLGDLENEAFDAEGAIATLKSRIEAEQAPKEVALARAARDAGVTYLGHDDTISLGLGVGSVSYDAGDLPAPGDVDWDALHDIPVAMVTGTNGKSTTVRLTAAIGKAAGRCVGLSSSDWVKVGDEILDEGDYSGPAGARLAVRDKRVELGIIETARGGLMRRGLPIPAADACLLTNIAADHLGTYGVMDVATLADAKFVLAKAVRPHGRLVLNADDPELVARSTRFEGEITWFGLDFDAKARDVWIKSGGRAAFVSQGRMMLARDGETHEILAVDDFVPALKGAAKFNVYNALGAIALADALDLPMDAMTRGLQGFTDSPQENPGRGNYIELGGITLLIDFAHNPHGMKALAPAIRSIPAKRRLVIAAQAGDRSDQDTRDLIQSIWEFDPDAVVVAELPQKLRGRQIGELTEIMADELRRLQLDEANILTAGSEFEAVKKALDWARPGDFLALLVHDDRVETMALLDRLGTEGWQAGQGLPADA